MYVCMYIGLGLARSETFVCLTASIALFVHRSQSAHLCPAMYNICSYYARSSAYLSYAKARLCAFEFALGIYLGFHVVHSVKYKLAA